MSPAVWFALSLSIVRQTAGRELASKKDKLRQSFVCETDFDG